MSNQGTGFIPSIGLVGLIGSIGWTNGTNKTNKTNKTKWLENDIEYMNPPQHWRTRRRESYRSDWTGKTGSIGPISLIRLDQQNQ